MKIPLHLGGWAGVFALAFSSCLLILAGLAYHHNWQVIVQFNNYGEAWFDVAFFALGWIIGLLAIVEGIVREKALN